MHTLNQTYSAAFVDILHMSKLKSNENFYALRAGNSKFTSSNIPSSLIRVLGRLISVCRMYIIAKKRTIVNIEAQNIVLF